MKKFLIKTLILLTGLFIIYSCIDDKSTNPGSPADNGNYFPNSEGSSYKYEITRTDTNGSVIAGNRFITYDGDSLIRRTNYQIQLDTLEIISQKIPFTTFFRTTETGVFYFVDTSGISVLVPDSIRSSVTLHTEMRLFLFPFVPGNSWAVYRVSYDINDQFSYNIVDFTAKYFSDEKLKLNLNGISATFNTKKVEYLLTIQLEPNIPPQNYTAYVWVADNIGILKSEGSAAILGVLSGGGIVFTDTLGIYIQNLIEYDIK